MNDFPPIILASSSPRRKELLGALGIPFRIQPADVDEDALEKAFHGDLHDLAPYLAQHKAQAILDRLDPSDPSVVLAADTTVLLDNQILGKPRDVADAWSILRQLRNRTHEVTTGIALYGRHPALRQVTRHTTPVTMRNFSDDEIAAYIATGDPFDKAGAYAIQHSLFKPVARIAGCATNVIGLPMCVLVNCLQDRGIEVQPPATGNPCPWHGECLL